MPNRLHIITACTKRKRKRAKDIHRIEKMLATTLDNKASLWLEHLQTEGKKYTASHLYAGEFWQQILQLEKEAKEYGYCASLWILSAGYGLIPSDAMLFPYSATFTQGQPESIGRNATELQQWWDMLSKWEGPMPSLPRTIYDLVTCDPGASYLVIASPHYLKAVCNDLQTAASLLTEPERLIIVSAGSNADNAQDLPITPGDARLQHELGGTRTSLNPRIARRVLRYCEGIQLTRSTIHPFLQRLMEAQPDIVTPKRKTLLDADVCEFIEKSLQESPSICYTRALRSFREQGFACEQKRFSNLFMQVKGAF